MTYKVSSDFLVTLAAEYANGTGSVYKCYQDIWTYITANESSLGLDANTTFWYQQAVNINDPTDNGSLARTYIRSETAYGQRLDGLTPTDNGQAVSDDIGRHVIQSVLDTGTLLSLPQLLGQDISVAINDAHVTIGGWGGSFYYWTSQPQYGDGSLGQSPGSQIVQNLVTGTDFDKGGQFDKFVAANAAAFNDTGMLPTYNGVNGYVTSLSTAWNASAPWSVKVDLFARSNDILHGSAIVGSPDVIDGNLYDEGTQQWHSVATTYTELGQFPELIGPNLSESDLNAERAYRLAHQSILGDSNGAGGGAGGTSPAEYGYGTSVNPDGSFASIMYQQAPETQGSGADFDEDIYNANGAIVQSVDGGTGSNQYGIYSTSVDIFAPVGNSVVDSAMFSSPSPDERQTMSDLWISPTDGNWKEDHLSFITGTENVSSISFYANDGSTIYLTLPQSNQPNWNAQFDDSNNQLEKYVSYGTFYDPSTQQSSLGTQTLENGVSTTVFGASSFDPTSYLPSDAPHDFLQAAGLWSADLKAAEAAPPPFGTSSSTAAHTALAEASGHVLATDPHLFG